MPKYLKSEKGSQHVVVQQLNIMNHLGPQSVEIYSFKGFQLNGKTVADRNAELLDLWLLGQISYEEMYKAIEEEEVVT